MDFKKRREEFSNYIKGNGCMIFFSGKEIMSSEDECYPFMVNRNFYYLTGLERPDMILMITKHNGIYGEEIFALPLDEYVAKWVGGRLTHKEISEISNVEAVSDYSEFYDVFASYYNYCIRKDENYEIYLDMWKYNPEQDDSQAIKCAKKLKELYPTITIKDAYPVMCKKRMIKDDDEIKYMSEAISITNIAYEMMMRNIKPGMNELMMEALFDYSLKSKGCTQSAFKTICASGKNATCLHYSSNNQYMKDGDLFLCDFGATYKNYCADITRTFPVNGKFSPRQKEIYDIVLNAQKLVEENAKAGVSLGELNQMVVDYYKDELPKHGLNKDVREYYYHSISHHLGLDTHDLSLSRMEPLKEGNVITNEPGLYIEEEGIGIRIEDDLLITSNGNINLAKDIIKETEDIERFMSVRS